MSGSRALLLAATAALVVATTTLAVVPLARGAAQVGRPPAAPVDASGATTPVAIGSASSGRRTTERHSAASQPSAAQLDAAMCAADSGGKLIRVSISRQRAWLCDGPSLALATPVTTGADTPDRRTVPGTWQIQAKQTHRWLGGPGYSVQVDFWMPYDGDFGLHDASWQTMPFGAPGWRTDGSHGCVHLPHAAMAQLYGWAPVGTTVTVEA